MNFFRLRNLLIILILARTVFSQFGMDEELVDVQVFQSFENIHKGSELKIAVKAIVKETWHINSDTPNEEFLIATALEIKGESPFQFASVKYPEAENIKFSFSDQPVSVFEGEVLIGAIIKIPDNIELGEYTVPIEFTYQACNDITCMPPNSVVSEITFNVVDNQTAIKEINSELFSKLDLSYSAPEKADEGDSLMGKLEESGLILSLILVFLGGLALNLTPCVYPLIPITIGYFGGQSEGSTGRLFVLGILYVLGMALTYSVVGVVTSLSGAVFGTLLQNPIVIVSIAAVFIALSLSMFGLYEFKLPDSWVMKAGGARSGMFGAFFMGLTMGIVAAPCIGPFVIGLVTYVAAKGDPFYGFLMFFVMAVGLGTPYLFLALFSGKIKELPRAGFWMDAVKHIFGFILLGMAIYFLQPLLPKEVNHYLLPIFMILVAIYLLLFDKLANDVKGFRIFKTIFSLVIIAVGAYMLWPSESNAPDWNKFDIQKYESALENNDKIIIDFYADWCIPCKELDALTFSDPNVISEMNSFTTFKVDMTKTMSEETEKIRQKFSIIGMPTVLIINSKGEEIERITGFMGPEEFLDIISKIN